ncbi:MAG TPA: TetR/AcrR family transcriptional regulator [Longimicrobiaceae bacterium]|nr:TetR/AcrR family transcriptional regulator [Longimicrobiaceae bacterium]
MASTDKQTEQRILDAAHAVFLRRGTAGARMQEIADEAGANKALLHYYFRSKEKLAEAVFQRAARNLFPPLVRVLGSDASIEEKVRGIVDLYLETMSASPFLPGYVLSELNHHPERITRLMESLTGTPNGLSPRLFERLAAQIDERVRAGTMRPITAPEFVVNLLSLCLFPFAARPLFSAAFGWDQGGFDGFIEERRTNLVAFFMSSLKV